MTGLQGHVGYPQKAKNPIPVLAQLVTQLTDHVLDKGNAHFDPSTLSFTSMDVGNDATNVIPREARAAFNIRFNDKHTPESLINWVTDRSQRLAKESGCADRGRRSRSAASSFVTQPGKFTQLVSDTVASVTGTVAVFLHHRRHLGRALHQGFLPGGGIGTWPAPPCTRPMNAWRCPRSQP